MPVLTLVTERILLGVFSILVISMLIFASIQMLPGDFAASILGNAATPEAVASLRAELKLDQSPFTQYFSWIGALMQGDFGMSLSGRTANGGGRFVAELIGPRLQNTFFLAGLTAIIAVPLALSLGVLTALYKNSIFDRVVNIVTMSAISMPEFLIAYLMILIFAMQLEWLPSLSSVADGASLMARVYVCLLPALVLTFIITAHIMRMTRTSIVALMAANYVEMAKLKGINRLRIVVHHIFPNALAAIVNVVALNLAYLVVGIVIIEVIFVYPGMGQLMVDSVMMRDIPVVQACGMIFAITYISLNVLADILAIVSNPRLLHAK